MDVDLLGFGAAAFIVCGLAVVIWEVAVRGAPRDVIELLTDVRGFAERPAERRNSDNADESVRPAAKPAPRRRTA